MRLSCGACELRCDLTEILVSKSFEPCKCRYKLSNTFCRIHPSYILTRRRSSVLI